MAGPLDVCFSLMSVCREKMGSDHSTQPKYENDGQASHLTGTGISRFAYSSTETPLVIG